MNKKELASFQTKSKIINIARVKFAAKGFDNTSLQELVEAIGLTRGAFYHHFKNKEEIFYEVIKIIQHEIGDYVQKRAAESENPWEQLVRGCTAFIEKAIDKEIRHIILVDGPSIISWKEWKTMDSENSESHLKEQLLIMQSKGIIKKIHIDYLTSFISGGLNELAIYISKSEDFNMEDIETAIRLMLKGIRENGAKT